MMHIQLPDINFTASNEIELHRFYLRAVEGEFTKLIFPLLRNEDRDYVTIVFDHGKGVHLELLSLEYNSRLFRVDHLLVEPTIGTLQKPKKLSIGDLCLNESNGFGFVTATPGPGGGQSQLFDLRTMKVHPGSIVGHFPSYGIYFKHESDIEPLYDTGQDGQRS